MISQLEMVIGLVEADDRLIMHNKYPGCWWPGDSRSQAINSNDIDILE